MTTSLIYRAMDFTKIGKKSGTVILQWDESVPDGLPEKRTLECESPPLPSFDDALQALKSDGLNVLRLDRLQRDGQDYDYGEQVTVHSVSMNRSQDDLRVSIQMKRGLAHTGGDLTMNVPLHVADIECVEHIETLCREAARYHKRERAQFDLFEEDEEPTNVESPSGDGSPLDLPISDN